MVKSIEAGQLLYLQGTPVIDVRTPSEFAIGHIPGAVNIPLFEDDERALVGTRYHNSGKEAGFLLGLELIGPKMAGFVKKLNSLFHVHSPLILYCWRGGMRSNAMAWLFNQAGHECMVIEGGYKAFRSFIRHQITNEWNYRIIGGMTGCGKTETIKYLSEDGIQVIDLEALASHKGSVFGHLGQKEQPTNETFENQLWQELSKMDPSKPVYLEDESRSIGKVSLPEPFYRKMQVSPMFLLELSIEDRIQRLVNEYGTFSKEQLIENISKLSKYIGGDIINNSVSAVMNDNNELATQLLLPYYDKKYKESITRVSERVIIPIKECSIDSRLNSELLLSKIREINNFTYKLNESNLPGL